MGGTPNEAGPLGPWQAKQPVLLVFAPAPESPAYMEQALWIEYEKEGFLLRDLVLLELFTEGESRAAGAPLDAVDVDVLHKEFGIGPADFCVVLVGRDGTERVRWRDAPVPAEEIFRWLDAG
jgi:hypothetical protein